MPTSRFIRLEPERDDRLREIEQNPYLEPKVRLRARVLRLFSHRGGTVGRIAAYAGRSRASICRDFERWEQRGVEGLTDGAANRATLRA